MKLRVLIADDHALLRDGLKALVNAQPDMEIVGEAADGQATCERVRELQPDILLLDISLPDLNGLAAAEAIMQECPAVKIVVLTAHKDRTYLDLALKVGVSGYVLKLSAARDLIEAVRTVAAGKFFLDPALADRNSGVDVQAQFLKGELQGKELTSREEEILTLTAEGYSNKEIAAQLSIAVKTVESHKARLMQKLELRSRTEIVRYAVRRGWLR